MSWDLFFCDYRNPTRNYRVFAAYILEPGGHWTMNMKRNAAGMCIRARVETLGPRHQTRDPINGALLLVVELDIHYPNGEMNRKLE
jgi:hypothetical protein